MATEYLKPTSDGTVALTPNTGTDHYALVDDATDTSHDSDSTCVTCQDSTKSDEFGMGNLTATEGTCSVKLYAAAKWQTTSGAIRLGVKVGATTYWSSSSNLTSSYAWYSNTWATNPATGIAWTISEVNALIAVLELAPPNKSVARASCLYAEVDVTAGGSIVFAKVHGIAKASIAKIKGVAIASIAKIMGK